MAETKAPIVVAPNELVALYDQLYEREWNKETGAFKNPVNVMRSVLHYGRVAASRIVDVFEQLTQLANRHTALEANVKKLEASVKALETFRHEAEEQATEVLAQFQNMMAGGGTAAPAEAAVSVLAATTPATLPAPTTALAIVPTEPAAPDVATTAATESKPTKKEKEKK